MSCFASTGPRNSRPLLLPRYPRLRHPLRIKDLDDALLGEAVALPSGIESASITPARTLIVGYDPERIDEEAVLSYLEDLGQVLFENYSALEELPADEARRRMQSLDNDRPTPEDLRRILASSKA